MKKYILITFVLCFALSANAQFTMTASLNYFGSSEVTKYYQIESTGIYSQVKQKGGGLYAHLYPKQRLLRLGNGKISIGGDLGLGLFSFSESILVLGVDISACIDYNLGYLGNPFSSSPFAYFVGVGYTYHSSSGPTKDERVFIPKNEIPKDESPSTMYLGLTDQNTYIELDKLRDNMEKGGLEKSLLYRLGPMVHAGFFYKGHGINFIYQPSINNSIMYYAIGYTETINRKFFRDR